jgi:hypothetical protein
MMKLLFLTVPPESGQGTGMDADRDVMVENGAFIFTVPFPLGIAGLCPFPYHDREPHGLHCSAL